MITPRRIAAVGALVLASAAAGCDDVLSGPELSTDPNRPWVAYIDQLFHGTQLTTFFWHTGNLARSASMWTQQMAETDRQYISYDTYELGEDEFNDEWVAVYTSGGLVDMRKVQELADAQGLHIHGGIARVHETFLIGMAASLWGDIPYSEAVSEAATPRFDEQAEVYARIKAVLDEAITELSAGGGRAASLDLIYGGDAGLWTRAARTLKVRFYMHWVEAQLAAGGAAAAAACGGDCLQKAIAAAQQGSSSPAGDLRTFHTETPGQQNLWYQFVAVFRPGYLSAGKAMVELLESRNDQRVAEFFSTEGGEYVGAPPGSAGAYSQLNQATRGAQGYDQPLITFAENQLILAEAQARSGNTGAALAAFQGARTAYGLDTPTPALGQLLDEIKLEKYIAMFQTIEVWNDMKRNCTPSLTPPVGAPGLIARLFYSGEERNTNHDTPPLGTLFDRNDNDPDPWPLA